MCDSARFVETVDELRVLADMELLPRAPDEFELTPGVRLEPREFPAFIAGEELRPAPVVADRFAPFAPFTPPRIELFALEPPPARPK